MSSITADPPAIDRIATIHTLGPTGTNCEAAAKHYVAEAGLDARVELHETLEAAIEIVRKDPASALLGCVVYPDLHKLVFPYLGQMRLADVFLYDTFNMVLAARSADDPMHLVGTHPAPSALVPEGCEKRFCNSNSEAARFCRAGEVDACITTSPAAAATGLTTLRDFGPVPMGFTIHVPQH